MDRLTRNEPTKSATGVGHWDDKTNGYFVSASQEEKPKSDTTGSSGGDELGQIDGLIGDFGRYQLLIFMFKILIG